MVFIVGPALVTTLATTVHPLAGPDHRRGRHVRRHRGPRDPAAYRAAGRRRRTPGRRGPPMPWRVLAPLIACAFAMGALLGGAEVATVALSEELGATSLAGLMLAVWAVGSLVSGVIVGAVHSRALERGPVPARGWSASAC